MADFFGKGIGVAAGFDLGAAAPLDTRTVVTNMEELQAHIDGGRAYEGMMIYVEADAKMYIVKKGAEGGFEVEEFGFNQEKFDQGLEGVNGRLDALEAKDVELEAKDTALEGRITTLEGLVVGGEGEGLSAILADVEALKGTVGNEEAGLVADMAAVEGRLDDLEEIDHEAIKALAQQGVDNAATAQQAAKAAQGAADKAQGDVNGLAERVGALEGIDRDAYKAADEQVLAAAKEHAQGLVDGEKELREAAEGEIKGRLDAIEAIKHHDHENKEVLDGITAEKVAAWDGAKQAAKDYADQAITALVGSAPEAMDTLGELAQAIKDHGDVYKAYVEEVSGKLAGKVDKVEGSRLVSEEEIAAFGAKAEKSDVEAAQAAAEKVATEGDAALQEQINALKGTGEGSVSEQIGAAKEELQDAIDGVAGDVEEVQGKVEGLEQAVGQDGEQPTGLFAEIAALKAKDAELVAEDQRIVGLVEAAQTQADKGVEDAAAAQQAADKAQEEVDALEVVVGAPAKDGAEASGLFAEITALKAKDVAIEEKNTSQDTRLAAIEEMMGLGGGEGNTSALEQFANDIAGLKSKVGAPAVEGEEPQPATGLFAEIASLKTRDGELQGAVDAEAQRADAEEKRIVGLVDGLTGRMDNAEGAMAQAQEAIAGIQDTINKNAAADGEVKGRVDALEAVVGKAAQEEEVATGLFAQIAALAAKNAEQDQKAAELEAAIGVPAGEGQEATGVYAHIKSLHDGVAETFAAIKTEIGEDGKLHTSVAGREVSATDVPVMEEEDITSVLADILGDAQPQE